MRAPRLAVTRRWFGRGSAGDGDQRVSPPRSCERGPRPYHRARGRRHRRMSGLDALVPERTALLVVDMQNAFCHPAGTLGISGVDVAPAQAIVPRVERLVKGCQNAEIAVIWTQQEHFPRDRSRERKRLPSHVAKRARVSCLSGTWDTEFVDELRPLVADSNLVVRKHRFG